MNNKYFSIYLSLWEINYAVFLVSGCGAGEYLNDGNSGNSMCSSCQPGEYQALEFHRQTSCQRCSGIQNTPKGAPGTQDLLVQFLSFHTVLEGNGQNNRLAPHLWDSPHLRNHANNCWSVIWPTVLLWFVKESTNIWKIFSIIFKDPFTTVIY